MSRRKTSIDAANVAVPQSDSEAAEFVRHTGEAAREIARIEAGLNDEIAALTAAARARCAELAATADAYRKGLQIYCEAHRARLTNGRTKTVDFATGTCSWRERVVSINLSAKVAVVVDRLKQLGFSDFIRVKEEVDKEAMRKDPERAAMVAGVSIGGGGEAFYVEPFEAALESQR